MYDNICILKWKEKRSFTPHIPYTNINIKNFESANPILKQHKCHVHQLPGLQRDLRSHSCRHNCVKLLTIQECFWQQRQSQDLVIHRHKKHSIARTTNGQLIYHPSSARQSNWWTPRAPYNVLSFPKWNLNPPPPCASPRNAPAESASRSGSG